MRHQARHHYGAHDDGADVVRLILIAGHAVVGRMCLLRGDVEARWPALPAVEEDHSAGVGLVSALALLWTRFGAVWVQARPG